MFDLLSDVGVGVGLTAGVGYLLTAGFLGITHGIEPDHVAGIAALTHEAADPKLSALVGGCFAAGHALLVVVWVATAYVLFGTTSFPGVFEQFGTLFVGIVLGLLSLYLGVTGTRKLVHRHTHDHGDQPHSHYHVHLPTSIRPTAEGHGEHSHDHSTVEYLKIGTVGALFTLSPPVSMIAFISVTIPGGGTPLMVGIVATYAVTIIATMALIGGGAGSLFKFSKDRGERVHAISQVVASVLVLGFAVNVLSGLLLPS
ncbi:hypothetical protein [Haloarcula salinisoli]|uniref:Nickel/cobalt efflux system n=1 Tax=Haloarcula salinisoli TaxID=2487746 RepID=A0A8J8C8K5_9EURY|nr:hypothetical protein [Halomicroarcula salinisoli]MBX0287134.1 hypothetical protein [Halomicroarcula salinisoli]MBX0304437.1 hypothetical protein [Halomicroarcula salinisoli]